MTVYVDNNDCIKAVGVTSDSTLTPIEITDGTFDGWSDGKICCYKINVVDGNVTMLTPYVDSRVIEHYDRLSTATEEVSESITETYKPTYPYVNGEYCTFNGILYRFTQDNGIGIPPTNSVYWVECDIASELNRIITMIKEITV